MENLVLQPTNIKRTTMKSFGFIVRFADVHLNQMNGPYELKTVALIADENLNDHSHRSHYHFSYG